MRLATVGGGTSAALPTSLAAAFTPSLANAETLAAELPRDASGAQQSVLYPASALASRDLQRGLAARGFSVTRLDTYDTVPATQLPPGAREAAGRASVVAFASPSAIKAWCALLAPSLQDGGVARLRVACIGLTSARAAVRAGLRGVHYPDAPGLEGWAQAVLAAARGEAARDEELLAALGGGAAARVAG